MGVRDGKDWKREGREKGRSQSEKEREPMDGMTYSG